MATAWTMAEGPRTEEQGWKLVGLQRPGSAQEEAHTWEQVRSEETLRYAAKYEGPEGHETVRARLRDFIDAHGHAGLGPTPR